MVGLVGFISTAPMTAADFHAALGGLIVCSIFVLIVMAIGMKSTASAE